jgi:hypothetical protein
MQSITAPVRLLLEISAAKAARRGNGDGGPACDIGSYEFLFSGSTPVQAPQEPIPLPPVVPDPIEPVIPDPVTTDPDYRTRHDRARDDGTCDTKSDDIRA